MRTESTNPVERDAVEFGAHLDSRLTGPRLGLLCARSVKEGKGGPRTVSDETVSKVSARRFAELAGTTAKRVQNHRIAWERAADEGLVPHGDELDPGEDVPPDEVSPHWDRLYDGTDRPMAEKRENGEADEPEEESEADEPAHSSSPKQLLGRLATFDEALPKSWPGWTTDERQEFCDGFVGRVTTSPVSSMGSRRHRRRNRRKGRVTSRATCTSRRRKRSPRSRSRRDPRLLRSDRRGGEHPTAAPVEVAA